MADRDAKRKRPITCLETGVTFESAYRAAKELGFADSRNIFRSIQRGTCTQGLHFYYADAPKPSPGFFLPPNRPPRPVVCLDTGETFESAFQAGRAFGIAAGAVRTSASTGVERNGLHFYYGDEPKPGPEFFRERHSKTRPIVCLETGETFDGNPAAPCTYRPRPSARPFATERPSPGSISTMETNRSRLRSSSSRSSPNAVRALCRWLPRLGPPRGTRVARTVASGPDARYNRCGR